MGVDAGRMHFKSREPMDLAPVSASRLVELLPVPPTVSAAWSPFSLHVIDPPPHVSLTFADHMLASHVSGVCRLRREVSGRSTEGWSGPGTVNLTPALLKTTMDAGGSLRTRHPDGCTPRAHASSWRITSSSRIRLYLPCRHRTPVAWRRLAQPISLHRLAELAGVSARHFERAFRQDMGVPPHTYVLQKRVAAARHLLLSQPTLAIQEIAARVGFGSPSHLASAFRRQTGYSPTAFRRLQSA